MTETQNDQKTHFSSIPLNFTFVYLIFAFIYFLRMYLFYFVVVVFYGVVVFSSLYFSLKSDETRFD